LSRGGESIEKVLDLSLFRYFEDLEDPRDGPALRHLLLDVVAIAICAVICGADNWVDVESYGHAQCEWLKQFLELPYGIPSHDRTYAVTLSSGGHALSGGGGDWPFWATANCQRSLTEATGSCTLRRSI
jgi:hypothetical protein